MRIAFFRRLLPLLVVLCLQQQATNGEENLYRLLGVSKSATTKEIKSAYRRKALDTHPDKRKDIPAEQAAAEFHKVVQAFEVLSDKDSRRMYDRTGRVQQGGGNQNNNAGRGGGGGGGFGGGFQFHWNFHGGHYQRRSRRLKDQFKVKECMSRVMHIVSLSQLETVMLDENGLLERNLLMVFVTPGDVETLVDDEIVFPYPFAAMSEQGIWWEDLLQTAKVRYNKINGLSKFFNLPTGDSMRKRGKPIFLFGRRGKPLKPESFTRLETGSRDEFDKWMWRQIEVQVHFRNDHHHPVELFWIHGQRAHDKGTLEPGHGVALTTMLTHEWWVRDSRVDKRNDSPGRHKLSKESMAAIWKIKDDQQKDYIIPPKDCIDLSGHCTWWKGQGECRKNPDFMREVCPLTCKHCSEANDKFKSYDHKEFA
ncbi:protein DnaJ [Seminavis robusta]|uniref:Protein DnaJ n=1 Tax=Seminavis robusta TaxID=568900 RepID=A0A9N8DMX0_9STRA|nr:protein DnaJ [Seminavis robusta]|eukprot:Sro233_g094120.1 protein DnaJ (423) ;mRNA; r:11570-12838